MDIPRTDVYIALCDECGGRGLVCLNDGVYQCWVCYGAGTIIKCLRCNEKVPCLCDVYGPDGPPKENCSTCH